MRRTPLDYMGSLDAKIRYSLHAWLFCEDRAETLRCFWNGIAFDYDPLTLDLTRSSTDSKPTRSFVKVL